VGGPQRAALEVAVEAELAADLRGRRLLVAGDHDGANPRSPARLDRGAGLVAQRVDHADQPDEHQPVRHILLAESPGTSLYANASTRSAWPRELPVVGEDPLAGARASSAGRPRR
jgi:hypothetical protein